MDKCIFCDIVAGIAPSKKVLETENTLVFYNIDPKAPVHVLVVPKKHYSKLFDCTERDVLGDLMQTARLSAEKLGINNNFKVVILNGEDAGQTVFHLHIHLLGGWKERGEHKLCQL